MAQFDLFGERARLGRWFSRPRENLLARDIGSILAVVCRALGSARGRAKQQPRAAVLPSFETDPLPFVPLN